MHGWIKETDPVFIVVKPQGWDFMAVKPQVWDLATICITLCGQIKGSSRDTTERGIRAIEMYHGKVMHIIGG